jgi:hypothetical protein
MYCTAVEETAASLHTALSLHIHSSQYDCLVEYIEDTAVKLQQLLVYRQLIVYTQHTAPKIID